MLRHEDVLSFEEITAFVTVAAGMGFSKVRVTGGEPLVRRGVVGLVREIGTIQGVDDLSMTTNGTLLPMFAEELRAAGLSRVNISLDTLDPGRFAELTRGGRVEDVLAGIDAAIAAGLNPIKINCVVERSREEPDAQAVAKFAAERGLAVRFIPRMVIGEGRFGRVDGGSGGDCRRCDRLRLSSDGFLRPCLFSDWKLNIRSIDYKEAIRQAIAAKPAEGIASKTNRMHEIGG